MIKFELVQDEYSLRARLMPALLVFVPAGLAAVAWAAPVSGSRAIGAALALATTFGLASLLAQLGRDAGKERQERLYQRWVGKPTTVVLRHATGAFNKHTLARYHSRLGALVPDLRLPSAQQEHENPAAADEIYGTCVDYLIANTRDHSKFRLVFEENLNYGYRRNLWAMKPAGLVVSLAALASIGALAAMMFGQQSGPDTLTVVSLLMTALVVSWWLVRIRPNWVRIAAEAYARQLIAACEQIEPRTPPSATRISIS